MNVINSARVRQKRKVGHGRKTQGWVVDLLAGVGVTSCFAGQSAAVAAA